MVYQLPTWLSNNSRYDRKSAMRSPRRAVHLLTSRTHSAQGSALYASMVWYNTFRYPPIQQPLGLASSSARTVRPTALVVLYPLPSPVVRRTCRASLIPRTRCVIWYPSAHAAAHSDLHQTFKILRDASFAKLAILPGQ